jgi:hypothetical protein
MVIVSVIVSIIVTNTSNRGEGATGFDAIKTDSTLDLTLSWLRFDAEI